MAISFVAAGTIGTGANPTAGVPSGVSAGDLLLLVTTGTAAPTAPTGWTSLYAQGTLRFLTIYYKYATSSETSLALTQTGTASKAVMMAYRGTGAFQTLPAVVNVTAGSSVTTNTITTTYANDYVVSFYSTGASPSGTLTPDAATTSRINSAPNGTVNGLLIADELQASAGVSTGRTATSTSNDNWSAIAIGFVPQRTVYWVGNGGTWNNTTTTNWADSTGGTGGVLPPSRWDDVVIDSSSGTGSIAVSSAANTSNCRNLTVTASQAITVGSAASQLLNIYGSTSLPSGGSFLFYATSAWTINFFNTTSETITSNGQSLPNVVINGVGGTLTLQDAFSLSSVATTGLTLTNGALNTNNQSVTFNAGNAAFIYSGGGTFSLTLGTTTFTSAGSNPWTFTSSAGMTLSATSSTFNFSGSSVAFNGAGLSYGTVNLTSANPSSLTIAGSNTFANLSVPNKSSGVGVISLAADITITGTFTAQPTASNPSFRYSIVSSVAGTQRTITSASNALFAVDFQDVIAAGAASWDDSSRTYYWGDARNNTGITFATGRTVYWNLIGSVAWSATAWALTPSGTPATTNYPLAQDTAAFTNSGAVATSLSMLTASNIGTIDASAKTSGTAYNIVAAGNIFGDVTLSAFCNVSSGTITFSGRGVSQSFNQNGSTISASFAFSGTGNTVNLASALTISSTITVNSGGFATNNYNISASTMAITGTTTRSVDLGSSTVSLTSTSTIWNANTTTGLTFSGSSSTIATTNTTATARAFVGGGLTYGTLSIGGATGASTLTISGSNTFNQITSVKTVAHVISFTAGTTQTIGTWGVTGSSGNAVSLVSATAGTTANISITNKTSGIDYLDIKDITCTNLQPITFFAGANTILRSNVIGCAAAAPVAGTYVHLLTSGTSWSVPANWINSSNEVHLFGAGGGGSGSRYTSPNGAAGAGGGGGGYTKATNLTLSGTVSYTIGAGGGGGATGSNGTSGGSTTFNSGAYSAGGGGGGTGTTTTSVAGTAGSGSTFNGGPGGTGALSTVAAQAGNGGGGGGGAGGPLGTGATGGNGFAAGATTANTAGGGGGGNGGGSNGSNGASATGGTGGNNNAGVGGGLSGNVGFNGGGGGGNVNASAGASGGVGVDVQYAGMGGGGGGGGSAAAAPTQVPSLFGGGGGGGGSSPAGTVRAGAAGAQGAIIIIYNSGTVYSDSITEGMGIADILSALGILSASATEGSSSGDSYESQVNFNSETTESVTSEDSTSSLRLLIDSITESTSIADLYSQYSILTADVSEGATLEDIVGTINIFASSITENIESADENVSIAVFYRSITEDITDGDSASAQAIFLVNATEASALADVISTSAIFGSAIVERFTVEEFAKQYGWIKINDDQNALWTSINNNQSASWSNLNDSQDPGWNQINDNQV